jgi:hypothetical protein
MRQALFSAIVVAVLASGIPAQAQDHDMMDHPMHMAAMGADGRQPVNFPPQMRQHILANMRDHMQALADILTALSAGDYAKAGQIADARLGLDSPAAAGCKAGAAVDAPQMSQPADKEQMMAQFMPEGMRKVGLAMHRSASDFAAEAAQAAKTGNGSDAIAALASVTQQCAACHSAYRVQ